MFTSEMLDYPYFSYYQEIDAVRHESPSAAAQLLLPRTLYANAAPFAPIQTSFVAGSRCRGVLLLFQPEYLHTFLYERTGRSIPLAKLDYSSINGRPDETNVMLVLEQIKRCRLHGNLSLASLFFDSKTIEMLLMFLDAADFSAEKLPASHPEDYAQIEKAVEALASESWVDMSIQQLAESVHMSRRKFTSIFKEVTGLTVLKYRNYLRIHRAVELLSDPNRSVSEIAIALGFSNTGSFSDFFKRNHGVAPSEYRRITAKEPPG